MHMNRTGVHRAPQARHKREATAKKQRGPELKPLLQWCGPDIFRGALPWGLADREPSQKEKALRFRVPKVLLSQETRG